MTEKELTQRKNQLMKDILALGDSRHHATKSPSSLVAKNICPLFESKEAGEPAIKGTLLHYVFEFVIQKKTFASSLDCLMKEALEIEFITEDDIEGIYWAIGALKEIIVEQTTTPAFSLEGAFLAGHAKCEREVEYLDESFEQISFGTLDFDMGCVLADLKTGQPRAFLEQMAFYAACKFQEDPLLSKILVIELFSGARQAPFYWITPQECDKILKEVFAKIEDPDKKPCQSDYCTWCKKSQTCTEVAEKAFQAQENREDLFPQTKSFRSSEVLTLAKGALDDFFRDPDCPETKKALESYSENLSYLYECAKASEAFLSGVKSSIKRALDYGVSIPNLDLTFKTTGAEITDIKKAFSLSGLPEAEFLENVSISPAKFHSMVGDVDKVESLFHKFKIEIPKEFSGKTKPLLKTHSRRALDYILECANILEPGKITSSVSFNNPKTSKQKLKAVKS